MPVLVRLGFLSSVLTYWQQCLNKKKLEEMDEKTKTALEIERNLDIHNKVMALLFSFPSPHYFSLWNIQGNNISFSVQYLNVS